MSRQLDQARFELFVLNLREQATADAVVRKALAEADDQSRPRRPRLRDRRLAA